MRIILSPTEWLEKLILISRDEFNSPDKVNHDEVPPCSIAQFTRSIKEFKNKSAAQYDRRMIRMRSLFPGLPQFEEICKNRCNKFVDSCCREYRFEYKDEDVDEDKDDDDNENDDDDDDDDDDEYEDEDEYEGEGEFNFNDDEYADEDEDKHAKKFHEKTIDLKYIINLCGYNLTHLDVEDYSFSEIMPLINNNCPNLESLWLGFKEIQNQDFENVFSNMSHLKSLSIKWRCEYSTLPISLVESLEQVGGTLEDFYLECYSKKNDFCLPHSLASVFLEFVVLKKLRIKGFELNQPLLESIGQMQNLVQLLFLCEWKEYQMLRNKINMYPIGNLKNLKHLLITFDYGVTDGFFINLSNNAKKLKYLSIPDTHITDVGKNALNNLKELNANLWEAPKK